MEKLNEIFKHNPTLLNEPEVVELLHYSREKYTAIFNRLTELDKFYGFVLEKCLHSESVLKRGHSNGKTIVAILEYIDKM